MLHIKRFSGGMCSNYFWLGLFSDLLKLYLFAQSAFVFDSIEEKNHAAIAGPIELQGIQILCRPLLHSVRMSEKITDGNCVSSVKS